MVLTVVPVQPQLFTVALFYAKCGRTRNLRPTGIYNMLGITSKIYSTLISLWCPNFTKNSTCNFSSHFANRRKRL